MSLRKQLVMIGAIILLLPLAVLNFAVLLEQSLRSSQKASHLQLTRFISEALSPALSDLPDPHPRLLLSPLNHHFILDGYQSDWTGVPWLKLADQTDTVRIKTGLADNQLYLLLELKDPSVMFRTPGSAEQGFDQLILSLHFSPARVKPNNPTGAQTIDHEPATPSSQTYTIYSDGPGPLRLLTGPGSNLTGVWQTSGTGSVIELKVALPDTPVSAINLAWIDANRQAVPTRQPLQKPHRSSHYSKEKKPILGSVQQGLPMLYLNHSVAQLASNLTPENTLLRIESYERQPLFQHDRMIDPDLLAGQSTWRGLIRSILTAKLDSGDLTEPDQHAGPNQAKAYTVWSQPNHSGAAILTTHYPVLAADKKNNPASDQHISAWVSLTSQTTNSAALADEAVFKVLTQVTVVMLIIIIALFTYASWLSWRIRTLKQRIIHAMDPEHHFQSSFQTDRINDELGDLSQGFADMLNRLQNYADYMESFASKLTHECRTPLAIVSSSLQLMDDADEQQQRQYLQRAQMGTARISTLLTAMRQANQLEASIQQQQKQSTDLVPVVRELGAAYQHLFNRHHVMTDIHCDRAIIHGNADLIAQALDKLMDNAKDFTQRQGTITLGLSAQAEHISLWVENQGKAIPESHLPKLFQPFISHRGNSGIGDNSDNSEEGDEQLHLGLGLVIVKLIAEYHGAKVLVENQVENREKNHTQTTTDSEQNRVRFSLVFALN